MTPRTTLAGIVALLTGVAVLVITDGVMVTTLGVVLLVIGLVVIAAAGLLGLRTDDPGRANEAEQAKQAADTAGLKRASETGRWPRIIGGG